MDPLTHAVAGFVVGAAGGGGEAEIATAFVASLAPDAEFITRRIPRTAFLDYHHGLIHAAFGGILAAVGIAIVGSWVAGTPWVSLLPFALAGVASHIILDLLMHNNGIALWAPFSRKRVAFPIVLGLNPRTASKHCKEGRYGTCFLCQAHGSLFNPFLWVLLCGALVGIVFPATRQAAAVISMLFLLVYSAMVLTRKTKADRLVRGNTKRALRKKTFPASFDSRKWLVVRETVDQFESSLVDTQQHAVLWSHSLLKLPIPAAVEKTMSIISVRGFQNSVIFPYWTHEMKDGVDHIVWSDLSYGFSTDVELYALRIRMNRDGEIVQNEFHERW